MAFGSLLVMGSLAEAVANSIETQDQFTIPVATRDVRPRRAELVVVSLKDTRGRSSYSSLARC
jgi:hypothetical protein